MKISTWTFHRKITIDSHWNYCLKFQIAGSALQFILHDHFNSFHRSSSKALSSFPLCHQGEATRAFTARKNCAPLIGTTMEEVCKFQYSFSVVKSLSHRVPNQSIASFLSMCANTKPEPCKVIYLVRDPRALILSQMKLNFMRRSTLKNGKPQTQDILKHT